MKKRSIILGLLAATILLPFAFGWTMVIPVKDAGTQSWNHETFWYHPWGKSGVHKGIDIFAKMDTPVIAATGGIVLYNGTMGQGGNVVLMWGPKWQLHYYAHLSSSSVSMLSYHARGDVIGAVGDTGNAKGKSPHLHYTIVTLIPYPWRADSDPQGWKKIVFLDPGAMLLAHQE